MKNKKLIGLFLILLIFLFSCNGLTETETVLGMKLGGEYDEQIEIGLENGLCQNNPCNYQIINESPNGSINAYPKLYYNYYKDTKILSRVELRFSDPYNVPTVNNVVVHALTYSQTMKIESLYNEKYGDGDANCTYDFGEIVWNKDDIIITLSYSNKTIDYSLLPVNAKVYFKDKYSVYVVYEFNDKTRSKFDHERAIEEERQENKLI